MKSTGALTMGFIYVYKLLYKHELKIRIKKHPYFILSLK